MAQRSDEEYTFVPPDFDEKAFIRKEFLSFRTTVILVAWGIIAALVAWAAFGPVGGGDRGWYVGLAICAAFGLSLKLLFPRLGADVSAWGRREWVGTGFLFFFTFLGFWLVMVNPPLSDYAEPHVAVYASPPVQVEGTATVIDLFVSDNDRVADFAFTLTGPDGATVATKGDLARVKGGHYQYTTPASLPAGTYRLRADAEDPKGYRDAVDLTFIIRSETLLKVEGHDQPMQNPTGAIFVSVEEHDLDGDGEDNAACSKDLIAKLARDPDAPVCVRTAYLERDDGGRIVMEHDAQRGPLTWVVHSGFEGWQSGVNRVTVVVELADRIEGTHSVPGGRYQAGPFNVTHSGPLGDYMPKVIADPKPQDRNVPAPAGVLFAVLVLALAAVRRSKDRRD